jgi:dihydropteroate synthase
MGIVNATPDSFSDGGAHADVESATAHALRLVEEGADLLDVGGESTRPGAAEVPEDEQIRRVVPVIEGLVRRGVAVPISIDTRGARVAREAVAAGARIVNDVSGLTFDPAMRAAVAELDVPAVVMHMRGVPADMRSRAAYADVVLEVLDELRAALDAARAAGVRHVFADPGLGFAKAAEHSFALFAALPRFAALDAPLVVGASRKSFLASVAGGSPSAAAPPPAVGRLHASVAAAALAAWLGAHVVRVHDVAACRDAVRLADALRDASRSV